MNREIKFRALEKKTNKIFNWNQILNNLEHFFFGNKYELMQYTGLKDKNGKEIYEGDIVDRYGVALIGTIEERKIINSEVVETSAVVFDEEELFFTVEGTTNIGVYNGWNCLEIIGNIHENKELLK